MDEGDQRQGVLVLSEFSGSVRTLAAGALQINPWHADEVATSMLQVINMSAYERKIRFDTVNHYVREHTARLWALHLCTELQQIIPQSLLLTMGGPLSLASVVASNMRETEPVEHGNADRMKSQKPACALARMPA